MLKELQWEGMREKLSEKYLPFCPVVTPKRKKNALIIRQRMPYHAEKFKILPMAGNKKLQCNYSRRYNRNAEQEVIRGRLKHASEQTIVIGQRKLYALCFV